MLYEPDTYVHPTLSTISKCNERFTMNTETPTTSTSILSLLFHDQQLEVFQLHLRARLWLSVQRRPPLERLPPELRAMIFEQYILEHLATPAERNLLPSTPMRWRILTIVAAAINLAEVSICIWLVAKRATSIFWWLLVLPSIFSMFRRRLLSSDSTFLTRRFVFLKSISSFSTLTLMPCSELSRLMLHLKRHPVLCCPSRTTRVSFVMLSIPPSGRCSRKS